MNIPVLNLVTLSFGFILIVKGTKAEIKQERSIGNYLYCGISEPLEQGAEPLMNSPWAVLLTAVTEKGRDYIVDCGVTLIGSSRALTTNACLKKEDTTSFSVIIGLPSLNEMDKGVKRLVTNISLVLSDRRIAVLKFSVVLFGSSIKPACLDRSDIQGLYATVGWSNQQSNETDEVDMPSGKKVAYLRMQNYCLTDGYCARVLPVEEPWEMNADEIQEGAPLLIRKDGYWYLKGIKIDKNEAKPDDRQLEDNIKFINNYDIFFIKLSGQITDELTNDMIGVL